MKTGFCAATVLFCMFFLTSAARSSALFVPDSAGPAGVTSARPALRPSSPEVLRQRIARLSPDKLLGRSNVESIEMELFKDIRMKALQKDEQRDPSGFLLWTGDLQGVEGGKLVLVVRNGLIFASVYLPSSIIQIRPVQMAAGQGNNLTGSPQPVQGADDSQDYIVRQLAYPWKTAGATCGSESTSDGRKLAELVNLEREADGLPALEYSGKLTEAARRHATDMARHDLFSHELSDGEKFWQNVFDSGYPVSQVGENLAVGVATPEEAFECLFSSPEHRANIMNSNYTQTGVSDAVNTATAYRYFWAQEFGSASARSWRALRLSAN